MWRPSVYVDGQVLPTGHDSFYHARRALDAASAPEGVVDGLVQFDHQMHVPEGSWVTWPWGYDALLAGWVKLGSLVTGFSPELVLVHASALSSFTAVGVIALIARSIGLSVGLSALALFCFALSPITQWLHGLGRVDHHWAEHLATLATLWLGMRWLSEPGSRGRAMVGGASLGLVNALYNGLFLLAVPFVITLFIFWLRGRPLPAGGVVAWAAGLLLGIAVAVSPSGPLREGLFAYYLLSWFHVYIACAVVLAVLLLQALRPTRANVIFLAALYALLTWPIAGEIQAGLRLVTAQLPGLGGMTDVASPLRLAFADPAALTRHYTGLVWLGPVLWIWQLVRVARERRPPLVLFHLTCVLGALLLLQQQRFSQYGYFALYLPLLFAAANTWKVRRRVRLGIAGILVVSYAPVASALLQHPVPGFSGSYYLARAGYLALDAACRADPGVVLADPNDGHYVRYHTRCAVIGNNFLTTSQHAHKAALTRRLLSGTLTELRSEAPWVRYLWLIRNDNVLDPELREAEIRALNPGLRSWLLQSPVSTSDITLLWEVLLPADLYVDRPRPSRFLVLARLYRLGPAPLVRTGVPPKLK